MGSIHYSDLLKELELYDHERSGETFSIEWDECNREKATGGKRRYVAKAKKCGLPYHCADNEMRGILDTESGKTTAVHLRLICRFNDKTVYW
jgi:hypothetical protein